MPDRHIFVTGMTGSGKSRIGKAVAEAMRMPFLDLDAAIESREGRSIPAIFAEVGEEGFRRLETAMLQDVVQGAPALVSTGGGTVIRPENQALMHANGWIVFVDRPLNDILSDIDTSYRPLLKDGAESVKRLYAARIATYTKTADAVVVNRGSMEQACMLMKQKIRELLSRTEET